MFHLEKALFLLLSQRKTGKGKSFCKTGTVILSDLIKSVGVDTDSTSESDSSLCKKCAREIVNCCTMFHELEEGFISKIVSASETKDDECSGGGNKRLHSQNYSPSGLTPGSKSRKVLRPGKQKVGVDRGKRFFN